MRSEAKIREAIKMLEQAVHIAGESSASTNILAAVTGLHYALGEPSPLDGVIDNLDMVFDAIKQAKNG